MTDELLDNGGWPRWEIHYEQVPGATIDSTPVLTEEIQRLRAEAKHWRDRWEAACAREDALAASAVNRHVEIKRLLDKVARLESQRDAVLAVAALHDYCDCGDAADIRAALGVQTGGEQP